MKCQILFSRKNKENISKCRLMIFLVGMQSVKPQRRKIYDTPIYATLYRNEQLSINSSSFTDIFLKTI